MTLAIVLTIIAIFTSICTGFGLGTLLYILSTNRDMFIAVPVLGTIVNILIAMLLIVVAAGVYMVTYNILAEVWPILIGEL